MNAQTTSLESDAYLREAIRVWCPTYPRRVTEKQVWAATPAEAFEAIQNRPALTPGYVSVFSFPYGHPKDGAVPVVDTVFIDFDIPNSGRYGRPAGPDEADPMAWYADMRDLLDTLRPVADLLLAEGYAQHVRVSLSGHKGVHLFVDIEPVPAHMGSKPQFEFGTGEYVEEMVTRLESLTGTDLSEYFDVSSADLSRLTRLPNTIHETATQNFGEPRYCVPVTLAELRELTPATYAELTRTPRHLPDERNPSVHGTEKLSAYISQARDVSRSSDSPAGRSGVSLSTYDRTADHSITLSGRYNSVESILRRKPCMWRFRQREDCFSRGGESHYFEFAVILELVLNRVPSETILDYFREVPGYDEHWTKTQIRRVVEQGYQRPVGADKLRLNAPAFMDTEHCTHCKAAFTN